MPLNAVNEKKTLFSDKFFYVHICHAYVKLIKSLIETEILWKLRDFNDLRSGVKHAQMKLRLYLLLYENENNFLFYITIICM